MVDTILGSDWSTRRGEFHKYCLRVVLQGPGEAAGEGRRSKEHLLQRSRSKKPPPPDEICLPKDVTEHVSDNLKPGECYQVRAGNEPSRSLKFHNPRPVGSDKYLVFNLHQHPSHTAHVQ